MVTEKDTRCRCKLIKTRFSQNVILPSPACCFKGSFKIYWKKVFGCGDETMESAFWANNIWRLMVFITMFQALYINSFFTAILWSGGGAIVIIPAWQGRNLRYNWLRNLLRVTYLASVSARIICGKHTRVWM